ncbi:MAG: acyl-CoA carboxylase subunit beta [Burkholderiaceae bacterium]
MSPPKTDRPHEPKPADMTAEPPPPATERLAQTADPAVDPADELDRRRRRAHALGGPEAVAAHHARGRLTARERIDLLADSDSFSELGILAGKGRYDAEGHFVESTPSNAIIGTARIDGRRVVLSADDFTLRGGSSESTVSDKWVYAERYAHEMEMPLVRMVDTAGGSVKLLEQQQSTKIPGYPSWPSISLLGRVPVVGIALGACAGLGAVKVAASHFSVMLRGASQLFAGGPPVVRQGIGVDIDKETLGGWDVQVRQAGVVNNVATDEADAVAQVRRFLSYLPRHVHEAPPRSTPAPADAAAQGWLDAAIPVDRRQVYDARRILRTLFDTDSLFEIAPLFGGALIACLGRIDGEPLGVLAGNPRSSGGALTSAAARKLERFVDLCDTFHLPVIHFVDAPGVMFGLEAERVGTMRDALRAIAAIEQARVPWLSVIVRRAFGVGGGMHGPKHGPEGRSLNHRVAWPTARWGSIPIEGGVAAAYRREIEASDDPRARRDELEAYYHRLSSPYRTAERFGVVDIIRPSETGRVIRDWLADAAPLAARQLGPRLRSMR